jgi:hypothetical protein
MKRLDSILLKVFLYGLPGVVALAVLLYPYRLGIATHAAGYVKLLYNSAGFIFAFWMILAIYLSVRLMVSGRFRDQALAKLTFMKERDEREVALTGKATKTTFLTSLAILILLFCLSCFQVSIYRVPPDKAVGGKTGFVTLGFGFNLWEGSGPVKADDTIQKKNILSYTGLPVSSSTVILVLIMWQIISYNFSMRRLIKCTEGDTGFRAL